MQNLDSTDLRRQRRASTPITHMSEKVRCQIVMRIKPLSGNVSSTLPSKLHALQRHFTCMNQSIKLIE